MKRWLCEDTVRTHSHGHRDTVSDTMDLVNRSFIVDCSRNDLPGTTALRQQKLGAADSDSCHSWDWTDCGTTPEQSESESDSPYFVFVLVWPPLAQVSWKQTHSNTHNNIYKRNRKVFLKQTNQLMFISCVFPAHFPSGLQWFSFFLLLFIIYILLSVTCLLPTEYGLNLVISVDCIVFVHCMYQFIFKVKKCTCINVCVCVCVCAYVCLCYVMCMCMCICMFLCM